MTVATRSGGDALKQRDCPRHLSQATDNRSSKVEDYFNAKSDAVRAKIDRHGAGDTGWIENLPSCPVYYPSKEEFTEDPLLYIQKIATQASKYGMCKIVSPVVASVPAGVVLTKEKPCFRFTTRIQPMRLATWDKDDKITFPMSGRHYSLTEYEKVANKVFARKFSTSAGLPPQFIETEFWKELVFGKTRMVEYASDVEGSAFSESRTDPLGQSKWNIKGINRLPSSTLRLLGNSIPGITEPMLYIGMLFSMFAWHVEDHYLYSINYHHCGAPKTWYGVPGNAAVDFEKVVQRHVYDQDMLKDTGRGAELDLLLGKTTMFAPILLLENGVPVYKALQNPGEFIITFPRAYHAGFSHGFNCAEAVNFAMADWFMLGAEACARYEFLKRIPLLPHEELLCKEALISCQTNPKRCHDDRDHNSKSHVKAAFVVSMQSHVEAQSLLKRQAAKIITSNFTSVLCGLCKHICYVAYTTCKCFLEPTCLNHGELFRDCKCGVDRTLVIRGDFSHLEAARQKFECESLEMSSNPDAHGSEGCHERGQCECPLFVAGQASDGLCDNPFCGGSVCTARSSIIADCKANQEEEESDSEVFRVKRRRVLPLHRQRFQVDEQGIASKMSVDDFKQTGLDQEAIKHSARTKKQEADSSVLEVSREDMCNRLVKGQPMDAEEVVSVLGQPCVEIHKERACQERMPIDDCQDRRPKGGHIAACTQGCVSPTSVSDETMVKDADTKAICDADRNEDGHIGDNDAVLVADTRDGKGCGKNIGVVDDGILTLAKEVLARHFSDKGRENNDDVLDDGIPPSVKDVVAKIPTDTSNNMTDDDVVKLRYNNDLGVMSERGVPSAYPNHISKPTTQETSSVLETTVSEDHTSSVREPLKGLVIHLNQKDEQSKKRRPSPGMICGEQEDAISEELINQEEIMKEEDPGMAWVLKDESVRSFFGGAGNRQALPFADHPAGVDKLCANVNVKQQDDTFLEEGELRERHQEYENVISSCSQSCVAVGSLAGCSHWSAVDGCPSMERQVDLQASSSFYRFLPQRDPSQVLSSSKNTKICGNTESVWQNGFSAVLPILESSRLFPSAASCEQREYYCPEVVPTERHIDAAQSCGSSSCSLIQSMSFVPTVDVDQSYRDASREFPPDRRRRTKWGRKGHSAPSMSDNHGYGDTTPRCNKPYYKPRSSHSSHFNNHKYKRASRGKERMPFRYHGRWPKPHHLNSSRSGSYGFDRNSKVAETPRGKRDFGEKGAGGAASMSAGLVRHEGYDPLDWQIFPTARPWQYSGALNYSPVKWTGRK